VAAAVGFTGGGAADTADTREEEGIAGATGAAAAGSPLTEVYPEPLWMGVVPRRTVPPRAVDIRAGNGCSNLFFVCFLLLPRE
jgi:hypothetical protein